MVSCQYVIYIDIYLFIYLLEAPSALQLIYHHNIFKHTPKKKKKKEFWPLL